MPFKYSAFTVMTPEYTIREAAALLEELGYDGVEWRVHSVPGEPPTKPDYWRGNKATVDIETIVESAQEIREISEDHGLEIVGLGTYLSYKMIDDVEKCMKAAREMDCPSVRVAPPKFDSSKDYLDLYEDAVDGFAKIAELAGQYGVRATIEQHFGNICSSACLGYRLVSNFDPDHVGIILDPGNSVYEGYEDWDLVLNMLGPYLAYIHVKNAAWVEDEVLDDGTKVWKPVMAPLREGFVSWRRAMKSLDRAGYGGWLSLEDFAPGETKSKLADGLAYLKALEREICG